MLLTLKQAETTWCPLMRHPTVQIVETRNDVGHGMQAVTVEKQVAVGNVYPQGDGLPILRAGCIGNRCALWRWSDADSPAVVAECGIRDRRGYCGLAGQPFYGVDGNA